MATFAVNPVPAPPDDELAKLRAIQTQFGLPMGMAAIAPHLPGARPAVPAAAAQQAAPQAAPAPQPMAAPARFASIPANPSGAPSFAPRAVLPPAVPTPAQADERSADAERTRLEATGSGVSQIKNPWLRGLARVGDVAGTIMFPAAAAAVPGTTLHHDVLLGQQNRRIATDQGEEEAAANTAKAGADAGLENASANEANASADLKRNPPPVPADFDVQNTAGGLMRINKATGEVEPLTLGGQPVMAPAAAGNPEIHETDQGLMMVGRDGKITPLMGPNGQPLMPAAPKASATPEQQFLDEYRQKNPKATVADAEKAYAGIAAGNREPNEYADWKAANPGGTAEQFDAAKAKATQDAETTSSTRTMREFAPTVVYFVDKLEPEIDALSKQLGPSAGRWNDFWQGKIGASNPQFAAMKTNLGLLSTALMRMHAGARGSEYLMQHFSDIIGQAKQSPDNMKASLDEIRQYAEMLKAENGGGAATGNGVAGAPKVGDTQQHAGASYKFDGKLWVRQ